MDQLVNRSSIDSSVRRLIADIINLPVENITPTSSPNNLNTWDSIAHLDVIIGLEQEFRVRLSARDIDQMIDVQHIVELLENKVR
ncbi:MAG: acyl carrier protein [Candidatus Binataceae bacterium]